MAHSYTPGLTVTERTTVRKKRLLPIPGNVLCKVGDAVRPETVLARAQLAGKVHVVNAANLLGIAPDEIQEYLVKKPGEAVRKEEVLAENKPFIKWLKTEVKAPTDGTLESVSTVTGQVLVREPPRLLDLLGYVHGAVVEVFPNQGATVETDCSYVQGIFGIGGEVWGDLAVVVKGPEQSLTAARITPDLKDKIVVGGAFLGFDVMKRAKDIGVAALVVGGIHDKDLRELLGYDLGVAITGTERVGFTLIVTEGFGAIPMAGKTFALLSRHAGQQASVSGATQIRAGVIRPELIIPRSLAQPAGAGTGRGGGEIAGITIGDQVRIIRDPLFGLIGSVTALPPELREIETESHVRVLEVEFPDKRRVVIPRANVEIIEGQ
jgi:hypothetical protein